MKADTLAELRARIERAHALAHDTRLAVWAARWAAGKHPGAPPPPARTGTRQGGRQGAPCPSE